MRTLVFVRRLGIAGGAAACCLLQSPAEASCSDCVSSANPWHDARAGRSGVQALRDSVKEWAAIRRTAEAALEQAIAMDNPGPLSVGMYGKPLGLLMCVGGGCAVKDASPGDGSSVLFYVAGVLFGLYLLCREYPRDPVNRRRQQRECLDMIESRRMGFSDLWAEGTVNRLLLDGTIDAGVIRNLLGRDASNPDFRWISALPRSALWLQSRVVSRDTLCELVLSDPVLKTGSFQSVWGNGGLELYELSLLSPEALRQVYERKKLSLEELRRLRHVESLVPAVLTEADIAPEFRAEIRATKDIARVLERHWSWLTDCCLKPGELASDAPVLQKTVEHIRESEREHSAVLAARKRDIQEDYEDDVAAAERLQERCHNRWKQEMELYEQVVVTEAGSRNLQARDNARRRDLEAEVEDLRARARKVRDRRLRMADSEWRTEKARMQRMWELALLQARA